MNPLLEEILYQKKEIAELKEKLKIAEEALNDVMKKSLGHDVQVYPNDRLKDVFMVAQEALKKIRGEE